MRRVSPEEAAQLLAEGYLYLDVRTPEEFAQERPAGAYNVPWQLSGPSGLVPNPDFLSDARLVCGPHARVVVGCASGVRSLAAASALEQAQGSCEIVEQRAGMAGARDAFGRVVARGWSALGLPRESGPEAERSYEAIKVRRPR